MYRKIQKVDKMSKKYKIRSLLKEKGTKGTKQGIYSYSIMYEYKSNFTRRRQEGNDDR